MKYLAFDLEIAAEIPEGETDWKQYRPLGITCAAAADNEGNLWNWWAHDDYGRFTPRMTGEQCRQMLADLGRLVDGFDYTLLTWNGLGFDFDILAEESGEPEICKRMALDHVDLMFQFFCFKGYPLGLDTAAKGMGLPGKTEGMDRAKAPELWAAGEYHKVLAYVSQDVKVTVTLAQAIKARGALNWISRSGRENQCQFLGFIPVRECITVPGPDTSWMTDPWPRSKFYEWTTTEQLLVIDN